MTGYTGLIGLPKKGQSPIDLDDNIVRSRRYPPLILNGHWLNDGEATLMNDGHTAKIVLSGDRIPSVITGGPLLNNEYEFHSAHFHWGKDNCNGAEHRINGTWFSMEAHCIHWNRKYLTFDEATEHNDGLAIFGYFFLVNDEPNHSFLENITDNLKYIVEAGSEVKIPPNSLYWMRQALHCSGYYVYSGSLTSAMYQECVTWIIFPLIIPIRACQVDEFRKLKNKQDERILSNCRSIQLLRGRRIFWATDYKS